MEEQKTNKWIDEVHLTKDGGVIKRKYKEGEGESP